MRCLGVSLRRAGGHACRAWRGGSSSSICRDSLLLSPLAATTAVAVQQRSFFGRSAARATPTAEEASALSLATSNELSTGGATATARPVQMRYAQKKRSTIGNVQQTPLFPGMFRLVTRFEGEHVYNYGKHTFTIFKESLGIAIIPGGCLFAYFLSSFPSCPIVPFEVKLAYLGLLALTSRVVSRGWGNRQRKDLTGRTAVVTGGTSGIGRATAAQLAAMGANVVILAPDNAAHVEPAMAYVKKHAAGGGAEQSVEFHALDLSDFIAVRDYCARWRHSGRPIDIFVNCAGVLQQKHVTTRFADDVQLAVNYLGPFLLTEGLLPAVEAAQGRIVYVSCSAHVGVKGNVVNTYLTGRGVWSPRVADKFDGLEQYGFTKLGNIFHAQDLAVRSYPEPPKRSINQRLVAQKDAKLRPAGDSRTAAEIAMEKRLEPRFTVCACTPGGVITNIYRDVALASGFRYLYYVLLLIMRTAWEGSQTVVNCCVRDELRNGGYYMNTTYQPAGLSKAACSVVERQQVMAWTRRKMGPYMRWD